jgi:hypothetical protein
VQLPSTDGTPIEAAKMRRSPGSGISGITTKQDKLNSSNAIGRKKSKLDNEDSLGGVLNLGIEVHIQERLGQKGQGGKNPRPREEIGNVCRDSGKRGGERKRN